MSVSATVRTSRDLHRDLVHDADFARVGVRAVLLFSLHLLAVVLGDVQRFVVVFAVAVVAHGDRARMGERSSTLQVPEIAGLHERSVEAVRV
jgi:hypothetical protein